MSAPKQNKKTLRSVAMADIENNENCLIFRLPDIILVMIFQYLDTLSLMHVSKVCRRWYHISHDKSLTASFDLRMCPLGLKELWKISRQKLTKNTTEIHVRGKFNRNKTMEKISLPYLVDLFGRCDVLKSLSLEHFDLREVPLEYLSQSQPLSCLSVRDSMLTMGWFNLLKEKNLLQCLRTLDLHSCSKISNNDLEAISYLNTLESLVLCNCYRISARGIPTIVRNIKSLKILDFSGCPAINDVVLFHISSLHLKKLSLRFCHLVTDYGVGQLFKEAGNSRKTLEMLDLYSVHEITDKSIDSIMLSSNNLKKLDIGGCSRLTEAKIETLCEDFPSLVVHNDPIANGECEKSENDYHCCKAMNITNH